MPKNQINHENGQWAQKRKKHPSEMKVAPPHKLLALHALLSADTSLTTFIAYALTVVTVCPIFRYRAARVANYSVLLAFKAIL